MENCEEFRVKYMFRRRWEVRGQILHMNKMSKFFFFGGVQEKSKNIILFSLYDYSMGGEVRKKIFFSFIVS